MLVIIEANQMAYPDVENVARYFQRLASTVVVVGKEENRFIIEGMVTLMELNGSQCYKNDNTLEERMKLYEGVIQEHGVTPDGTILISNNGIDLTAAILMNMDFVWGFDVS